MSLAYWRDICVLNFPEIDEEHVRLLYILESIYHDIQLAENTAGIQSKLHELFDTTLTHCETEERLMVIYRYP
jgi:hemerythrin